MTKTKLATFSADDIQALQPAMKIGLLATVNPEGLPHLTLLASLRANTPTQLTFGQFIEGTSKGFLRQNPRAGFLVMTLDKNLWRGKATFTHTARQGPEFDLYNNQPMFRYNAYFGVHTCLLYTSDAADDLLCVGFGGRRFLKKKKQHHTKKTYH